MKGFMTKKSFIWASLASVLIAITVFAAANNKISRVTQGIISVGGTSTTTGNTVVVADDPLKEYRILGITATVAGTSTAYTNTFSTAFTVTPTVATGIQPGVGQGTLTSLLSIRVTPTTSNVIVSGLSVNTPTNSVPLIIFGYTRTGVLE